MEKYKMHRKAQGRHPETVNKELAMVRRMMNLAAGEELEDVKLKVNPLKGMKLYKIKKRPYRVYKDDEFKDLYQAAPPHFKIMLLLAYGAGMRKTEIRTLKLSQIDFEASSIVLTETKTDDPRTIPLDTILLEKLKEIRDRDRSDYVCLTPNGKPYRSKTAWKTAWKNTFERANKKRAEENKPPIKPGRFHDHRHTFISNLVVNEKEDFETVMKLSGHEDIRSLKHYTHTHEEAKRAAIKKIGDRLCNMALDTYMDTSAPEVQPEPKNSNA